MSPAALWLTDRARLLCEKTACSKAEPLSPLSHADTRPKNTHKTHWNSAFPILACMSRRRKHPWKNFYKDLCAELESNPFASYRELSAWAGVSQPTFAVWRKEAEGTSQCIDSAMTKARRQQVVPVDKAMLEAAKNGSVEAAKQVYRRSGLVDDKPQAPPAPTTVVQINVPAPDAVNIIQGIATEVHTAQQQALPSTRKDDVPMLQGSNIFKAPVTIEHPAPTPEDEPADPDTPAQPTPRG